jgi:hypothetical protein
VPEALEGLVWHGLEARRDGEATRAHTQLAGACQVLRSGTLGLGAMETSSRASAAALTGKRAAKLSGSDPSPGQGAGALAEIVVAIQPIDALGADQHDVVLPGRKRQAGAGSQQRGATVDASRTFCPFAPPAPVCPFEHRLQPAQPRLRGPQERRVRDSGKCQSAWRATWR